MLPELITRLIRATANDLKLLIIGKGKGIYRGGWDGKVISNIDSEFVPIGTNLYEFGCEADFKGKAEREYIKRTLNPQGEVPLDCNFIFITPFIWEKAQEWADAKMKEGKWKSVRVFDGSKIVEWLAIAPLQSYWLAKEIGRAPGDGIISIEDYWQEWSAGTSHTLKPEVILAGRQRIAEKLNHKLQGQPCLIPVLASSREEAVAFCVAAMTNFPAETRESLYSKSVVVSANTSLRMLVANYNTLVIIPKLEDAAGLNIAVAKKHFVILPLGASDDVTMFPEDIILVLPKLDIEKFPIALMSSGFSNDEAYKISKETGRNITIFRRRYGFDLKSPDWAKPESARDIIPALLMGRWNEGMEGDRNLLSKIAKEPYELYIAKLSKWLNVPDSPVYNFGKQWRLASPLDAWSFISRFLTADDINLLKEAFVFAGRAINPSFELEADARLLASLYGKAFIYSSWSRQGLSESLVFIALYGEKFGIKSIDNPQSWVDNAVFELFNGIDGNVWQLLSELFPKIAEASPSVFLNTIEKELNKSESHISALFLEEKSIFYSNNYLHSLLWALEGLAWLPEYFARSVKVLAKLAQIDNGTGNSQNRAKNSLRSIFVSWNPQTLVRSIEDRIVVIKLINKSYPDVAWKLCCKLLPADRDINWPTHKFRWRMFEDEERVRYTLEEHNQHYSSIFEFMLSEIGSNEARALDMLNSIISFSAADRKRVLEAVENLAQQVEGTHTNIRNNIRDILSRHRTRAGKGSLLLSEEEFSLLDRLYEKLKPTSVVEEHEWLFTSDWPQIPEGFDYTKMEEHEVIIREARIAGLRQIMDALGLDLTIELKSNFLPHVLGDTLGYLIDNEVTFENILKQLLPQNDDTSGTVLYNIINRMYFDKGINSIKEVYESLQAQGFPEEQLTKIFNPLPCLQDVWDILETLPPNFLKSYSDNFHPRFNGLEQNLVIKAFDALAAANRYYAALDRSSAHVKVLSTNMLMDILNNAFNEKLEPIGTMEAFFVTKLFEELDTRSDITEDDIMALEKRYLNILNSSDSSRKPKLLHKLLANSPQEFVDILIALFPPENPDNNVENVWKRDVEQTKIYRAFNELINTFKSIPGTDSEGKINYKVLGEWINEVRRLALIADRLAMADYKIGRILANIPYHENWPADELCEIIDTLDVENITLQFKVEVSNRHGSTVRGVFDGGEIERGVASHYEELANKYSIRYPVSASVFRDIARDYKNWGKSQDLEADRSASEY